MDIRGTHFIKCTLGGHIPHLDKMRTLGGTFIKCALGGHINKMHIRGTH